MNMSAFTFVKIILLLHGNAFLYSPNNLTELSYVAINKTEEIKLIYCSVFHTEMNRTSSCTFQGLKH